MGLFFTPTNTTVLRLKGADATTYLQGQCTADVRGSLPVHALWLNRKGRVLAHTLVVPQTDHSFLLLAPHRSATSLITIITANLIADDVEVTDETHRWQRAVVWGSGNLEVSSHYYCYPSARCGEKNWEFLAPLDFVPPWPRVEESALEENRILAGVPSVPADVGEQEFPQEGGLEAWVNYQKGCYCGQEVMARIHAMGTLRRVLRRVSVPDKKFSLVSGLELKTPDGQKTVGIVRSVAGYHGLAMVPMDLPEGGLLASALGLVQCGELAGLAKT